MRISWALTVVRARRASVAAAALAALAAAIEGAALGLVDDGR
jgi:hypothetical protein